MGLICIILFYTKYNDLWQSLKITLSVDAFSCVCLIDNHIFKNKDCNIWPMSISKSCQKLDLALFEVMMSHCNVCWYCLLWVRSLKSGSLSHWSFMNFKGTFYEILIKHDHMTCSSSSWFTTITINSEFKWWSNIMFWKDY